MLVLSRKVNETVLIGDDVRVTILAVDGERVRIGIDAPKSMRIFRKELLNQTIDINKLAASTPDFKLDFSSAGEREEQKD